MFVCDGAFAEQRGGIVVKSDLQLMLGVETRFITAKLLLHNEVPVVTGISDYPLQLHLRFIDDLGGDDEFLHTGGRQLKLIVPQGLLTDSHQGTRAGFLLNRLLGDAVQPTIRKQHGDAIRLKRILILPNNGAL